MSVSNTKFTPYSDTVGIEERLNEIVEDYTKADHWGSTNGVCWASLTIEEMKTILGLLY